MVDFIRKGYLEVSGTLVERELQNKKNLVHSGFQTRDLPLTKRRRYHRATRADVGRVDKSSPGFNCAILDIYL